MSFSVTVTDVNRNEVIIVLSSISHIVKIGSHYMVHFTGTENSISLSLSEGQKLADALRK